MTTITPLTDAKDLITYSKIRCYGVLGGTYVALVNNISVERDKVTIWVQLDDDKGTSMPTIVCAPDTGIEVVEAPDLTPYGIVQEFIRLARIQWSDDVEGAAAEAVLDGLEARLPQILQRQNELKANS
jgi:hypothetical protein